MDRGSAANWNGNRGILTTDSGALINTPFTAIARYELEARPTATTPEELLAAAYASCFTMTLADRLAAAGYPSPSLRTEVRVQLVRPSGYWEIPSVRVHCSAGVTGISEHEFLEIAHAARIHGPIGRAMRAEITLTVSLDSAPGREWPLPSQRV
ncbi:MAG TPA: OsmC family peroxiredoxin [Kofleriaceae bacterium]